MKTIRSYTESQFNRLSIRTKRVLIAQDILARLEIGNFKPLHGWYSKIKGVGWRSNHDDSAKELIENQGCSVCAKGALVMAWVANFNKKKVCECLNFEEIEEIEEIFSGEMRDAMEAAFEGFDLCYRDKNLGRLKRVSLKNIMQNIVDNKGLFVWRGIKFGE